MLFFSPILYLVFCRHSVRSASPLSISIGIAPLIHLCFFLFISTLQTLATGSLVIMLFTILTITNSRRRLCPFLFLFVVACSHIPIYIPICFFLVCSLASYVYNAFRYNYRVLGILNWNSIYLGEGRPDTHMLLACCEYAIRVTIFCTSRHRLFSCSITIVVFQSACIRHV